MPDVVLKAGGAAFVGWKSVRVVRSLGALASSFEIAASEREPEDVSHPSLRTGVRCSVELESERAVVGWIDVVRPSYSKSEHRLAVGGRSLSGDVIDCSAVHSPSEWRNLKLERLASILAEPFGVRVSADVDTGAPFAKFTLQKGETAFAAIERLARQRAVLLVDDGSGGILITRAGRKRFSEVLEKGVNILSAEGEYSDRDRFSEYRVQAQAVGDDFASGRQVAAATGTATDPEIDRYRPKIITAEEQPGGGAGALRDRALWEASTRAGRARKVSVTVRGWQTGGEIWKPNYRVQVIDDFLGIRREMLIAGCTFEKSLQGGTRTTLALVRPEAFELLALPETGGQELDPTAAILGRLP